MTFNEMIEYYNTSKDNLIMTEKRIKMYFQRTDEDIINEMTFAREQGERVQANKISNKTMNIALTYEKMRRKYDEDWCKVYYKKYLELKYEIEFFEDAVDMLPYNARNIVKDFIDGDKTWEEVAQEHNISTSMVGKLRKKAEKELQEKYKIKSEQEEMYNLLL